MSRTNDKARWLKYWAPAILVGILISVFSVRSPSAGKSGQLVVPLLHWFFPSAAPRTLHHLLTAIRKFAAVFELGVFAVLVFRGIRAGRPGWRLRWGLGAVAIVVAYAAFNVTIARKAVHSSMVIPLWGAGVGTGSHSVDLTWDASRSVVVGYNVYRGIQSGGPFTKLNTTPVGTKYTDTTVESGRTYFFVVTAIDANNIESVYSNQVSQSIP